MSNSHQGIQFERPIGAPADLKELEYVTALHQTNEEQIRSNGTVHAKDIRNYLTSRHGIYVEADKIAERIIVQLCGTWVPDEDDATTKPKFKKSKPDQEPMMDICQLTSLLLIPYLRHEDREEAKKPPNSLMQAGMAEHVLGMILKELEMGGGGGGVDMDQFKSVDENFETGTRITSDLIQHMFDCYGEHSIPDDILDEMVEQAAAAPGGGGEEDDEELQSSQPRLKTRQKKKNNQAQVFWNKDSFQRALTADIQLYNPDWEEQQTTHLTDAQSVRSERAKGDRIKMERDFFTALTIDQGADQYRSVTWMMLLWVSLLFFYGCYMYDSSFTVQFNSCNNFAWGCDAASAIVNWLIVFGQLGIVGTLYICLGSLGNSSQPAELGSEKALQAGGVLVAMGVVVCATIVPNFVEGKAFIWNSNKVDGYEAMYWFCFSLGIILVCLQLIRMVDIFAPMGALGVGGRTRSEQSTKQAAAKKTNTMVENAMLLHVWPVLAGEKVKPGTGNRYPCKHAAPSVVKMAAQLHGNVQTLTGGEESDRALSNYKAMDDMTETTGGVLWAYQRLADGRIFDEEGVWLSARLITSTIVQLLVVAMLVVIYFVLVGQFEEDKSNTVAVGSRRLAMEDVFLQAGAATLQEQKAGEKQRHRRHRRVKAAGRHRHLQFISGVNDTHYTDGIGIYPNIIFDVNRTHFTDGSNVWPHNIFSHNGTHVFDNYFRYNTTHFTDGNQFYPYSLYATNGTHITNGEFVFDGVTITKLSGNPAVNGVEEWEFKIALALGLVVAVLATAGIAVVYVPSFVSTVLKFRSGVIESLKGDEQFQKLRDGPDSVTTLIGSALWGAAFTGMFCWLFVGGIAFVSVWSETRETALQIYALLLGLLAIFLTRFLITKLFRDLYVSSFYRKHPAAINFINVVLECWNLAIALGTMLLRAIKLSLVAFLYIGRIDVPTFANGVGYVGPFPLDFEHFSFKKDLLIHEAHRHPYLERVGMMYLLKLHHGKEFGSRAGAYWRMLFVLALMPWMRNYRVSNRPNQKALGDRSEDGEEYDNDDEFDDEHDYGSVMSLHGMDVEVDLTRRANEHLTQRNRDLKDALVDLRQRLRVSNKKVAQIERKSGLTARSTTGPTSVEGPSSIGQRSSAKEDDEDDSSCESEEPSGPISVQGPSAREDDSFSSESDGGQV